MNPMSIEASTVSGAAAANGLINEESSEPQHASDDVTLNSSSTSSTFSRLQLRRRKRHPPSDKRISFRDRPDLLKSRYFFYTFLYALFYIVGAGWGYSKKGNLFCLIISGFLGLMLLVFSLVHAYDYYNGAPLESMYVSVPFIVSMFFGALMSCFYAMGSSFKTSLPIAIVCWISVLFYGYALAKDYSDGSYYRDNDFVEAKNTEDLASLLKSRDEDSTVADSILPTQAPLPPTIKTKTTNNKVHSSRFNAIAKRNTTSTK